MRRVPAFWDASALVSLCVNEATSPLARAYFRRFVPVVWWGSPVEIQSAICRLQRESTITDAAKKGATARLQVLADGWREILPGDEVREVALQLLNNYSLRSADALQLAAALIWCEHHPARKNLISGDKRLSTAAKSAGFSVLELPT
jgi:uncharacterized protein